MKLSGREARAFLARPDPARGGILLYGADPVRVALKRRDLIAALIGPKGEEEMRLTRIAATDLRKEPALLLDAIKAQGFFPGARVALVEDAGDGLSKAIAPALDEWCAGDAHIVATAKQLPARSSLRKLFEGHADAVAIGIYDDPPSRDEIEAEARKQGLTSISGDAMEALIALSRSLDPGEFRQLITRLALYKLGDETPLSGEEIALLSPAAGEAALDDLLHAVAEGQSGRIGPLLSRLGAQGTQPVGLCIGAMRHFRTLHQIASGQNPRPPLFGPRRDRLQAQARKWGPHRLERAIRLLVETDLALRSSSRAPSQALIERALIRLSMLAGR